MAPKRLQRFRAFASIEYRGVEYMSPQDFLDSLTVDEPRERVFRRMVDDATIGRMLKNTPTLHTGGSERTFRSLGPSGIISYAEYLFILTLLTKSRDSFVVAFLMFDEDDDMRINKNEFLKVDEHQEEAKAHSSTVDTTILIHLFGHDGKKNLSFDEFQIFYNNLQRELIEIEFEEFARGKGTISTADFARLVLRYSTLHKNEQSPYLQRVNERANNAEGITLEQFRQFSMFLNNLEDFTKAVRLYTVADIPVSRGEFIRAVKCSTGFELDPHLVDALFCIFDANNDDRLSYSEFIAIMNDRLNRGFKSLSGKHATLGWKRFKNCVVNELAAFRH